MTLDQWTRLSAQAFRTASPDASSGCRNPSMKYVKPDYTLLRTRAVKVDSADIRRVMSMGSMTGPYETCGRGSVSTMVLSSVMTQDLVKCRAV